MIRTRMAARRAAREKFVSKIKDGIDPDTAADQTLLELQQEVLADSEFSSQEAPNAASWWAILMPILLEFLFALIERWTKR